MTAYVGSESDVDVFFDDVQVEHRPGLQVQETQYDPWGLNLAGVDYSSPSIKGLNQYQFNGKERQNDLGLSWSDYGARFYDRQVGRWHNVDPLSDKMRRYSTYNYAFDNPTRYIDPDGMGPFDGLLAYANQVKNQALKAVTNYVVRKVEENTIDVAKDAIKTTGNYIHKKVNSYEVYVKTNAHLRVGAELNINAGKASIGTVKAAEASVEYGSKSGTKFKGDYLGKDGKNTFNAGLSVKTSVGNFGYNYEKIYGTKTTNGMSDGTPTTNVEVGAEIEQIKGAEVKATSEEGGSISIGKSLEAGFIVVPGVGVEGGIRKVPEHE